MTARSIDPQPTPSSTEDAQAQATFVAPVVATVALHTPEVRAWLDQNFDQRVARQRAEADTAKLVTTFSLALAATLVATALQVSNTSKGLDVTASFLLGGAFLVTLVVIWLDNLDLPDADWLRQQLDKVMDTDAVVNELCKIERDCRKSNENWLQGVEIAMKVQLLLSGAAGLFAMVALLMSRGSS